MRAGAGRWRPTPVFVLTHHPRPSFTLADTAFHFIGVSPADALAQAKTAANGKDVRCGGGVRTVREFLEGASSTRCTSQWRPSSSAAAKPLELA